MSRFAGAADQLKAALLVNPHSPEEVADAIGRALVMPLDERIKRWRTMMDNVAGEDVIWWRYRFYRRARSGSAGCGIRKLTLI